MNLLRRRTATFINLPLCSAAVLICISISSYSQQTPKQFVKENIAEVKSISPDVTDYADLESIGNAIGNAQVVMLGEGSHGDATTFLAKSRLIKYLHEKKGFNVLAFETDFFAMNYGWEAVANNKVLRDSFIYESIYPIWTKCKTASHLLFEYLPGTYQTGTPLRLTGFDNQMGTFFSGRHLSRALDSLVRTLGLPISTKPNYDSEIRSVFDVMTTGSLKDSGLYEKHSAFLTELKQQLEDKLPAESLWHRTVESVIAKNLQNQTSNTDMGFSMNTRDRAMAANLAWLTNVKYRGEKIIVWAANFHIAKDAGSYNFGLGRDVRLITMGSVLAKDTAMASKIYSLGFAAYEGQTGWTTTKKKYTIQKPLVINFENWIRKDYAYAFVNLGQYAKDKPNDSTAFYMRATNHVNQKEQWHRVFDGIFFIRNMYGCVD